MVGSQCFFLALSDFLLYLKEHSPGKVSESAFTLCPEVEDGGPDPFPGVECVVNGRSPGLKLEPSRVPVCLFRFVFF